MILMMERLGARMLNRVVPKVTASAGPCSCEHGHSWCCGGYYNPYNTCASYCHGVYGCTIQRYNTLACGGYGG